MKLSKEIFMRVGTEFSYFNPDNEQNYYHI